MTTIAVKDNVMAADSRVVGDYAGTGIKLHRKKGAIVGFAGNAEQAMVFVDWYFDRKSRQPKVENEDEWEALVLTSKGIEYWGPSLRPIPQHEYAAIGSGSQHAITAMDCGKDAIQAVQMAARRDPWTGGRVVSMQLVPSARRKRERT